MIKSRRLIWAGHVVRKEEGRSAFKILTDKPTGKRSLGRTRHRWEDNIRMNLKEIGINTRNCIIIRNVLTRRRVYGTYPATARRHRRRSLVSCDVYGQ